MSLADLDLPAPWAYDPEASVTLSEYGCDDGSTDTKVPAEAWTHPERGVRLFRIHDQAAESQLADLGGRYGWSVSGVAFYGHLHDELDNILRFVRIRGWTT